MKINQKIKIIVQENLEPFEDFEKRIQSQIELITNSDKMYNPPILPLPCCASDGRMTIVLTWTEHEQK